MTSPRRPRGFTLIEAMIAIAILGMVGTMIWQGFSQTARNKARTEEALERYHLIHLALERMSRELSMAYVSFHMNPNPTLYVVRTGFVGTDRSAADRVDFTSFSHQRLRRDAHQSDQNELSYFLARHPKDPSRKVLARREQSRVDDDFRKGGQVQILLEDVTELEFKYLDPMTGQWVNTWDTTQTSMHPNRLPAQVKIFVTVPHPRKRGRTQTFGTRASLPLTWGLNHAAYNPL